MSDSGDLPFETNSILTIKEEVEISETQLQEQIFDRVEVNHLDHCVKHEKCSEIVNGSCHETEDNETERKDCEANTKTNIETIKEKSYDSRYPDDNSNSTRTNDGVEPLLKKNYTCSVCAKSFMHNYVLERHMNIHAGIRPYACPICPKRYTCPDTLRKHKKTCGKDVSRYKCTICEKTYVSRRSLNRHMDLHGDERPFKCEICPKSFTTKHDLSAHIKRHLNKGKIECTLCNQKFTDNSHRRKHEKTHSNHLMDYQCFICKLYFKWEGQYRSHLKDNKCEGNPQEFQKLIQAQNMETNEKSQKGTAFEEAYKQFIRNQDSHLIPNLLNFTA